MTSEYWLYFQSTWWPFVVVIPAAIAMAIWALANTQSWQAQVVGWSIFAVGVFVAVAMRMHGPRARIRAGAWPGLCTGDATPSTEKELREAVQRMYTQYGRPPTIVGSGWGFFLYRRGAPRPRIFTHKYKGRQEVDQLRWKAGTTIMAFTQEMKKRGKALETYPTMDYISMGAWFAMGNHGNGGPASGKSSDALMDARVLDMTTNTLVGSGPIKYTEIRKLFDAEQFSPDKPSKYCILDVRFEPLVDNTDVQKKGIIIDSPKACAEWLDPTAYLRVIFQGAARDYAIGLVWKPVYDRENSHRDSHLCSRYCQYTQIDNCSVACGCHEPISKFNGITTRFFANQWMPPILPLEVLAVTCAGYRNFEIFFRFDTELTPDLLHRLVRACIAIHKMHGGRSEIRVGGPNGIVCLDMSLRKNFDAPFQMLRDEFDVERCSLHLGKWNRVDEVPTAPLKRVAVGEL